jgi:uncharacterized cupredoxin-like copper-binding protein
MRRFGGGTGAAVPPRRSGTVAMPHRRHALPLAALLSGVALLASGCSLTQLPGPERDDRATPPARPKRVARKPGPTWATGAPVRVVMNDRFRYRPSVIMVRAGRRVTFAVTNAGKLPHEFILGDRATQLDHERQMQQAAPTAGDHTHVHTHGPADPAGPGALTVPPGETRRLTWTFHDPGIVLYGCHVLGHWAAGMKGTIVVLAPDRPLPSRPSQPSTAEPDTSRTATPGRSPNPPRSAVMTIRPRASAVAAMTRSCAPRRRPDRWAWASSSACERATSRS